LRLLARRHCCISKLGSCSGRELLRSKRLSFRRGNRQREQLRFDRLSSGWLDLLRHLRSQRRLDRLNRFRLNRHGRLFRFRFLCSPRLRRLLACELCCNSKLNNCGWHRGLLLHQGRGLRRLLNHLRSLSKAEED
jgi:hypothetical protein